MKTHDTIQDLRYRTYCNCVSNKRQTQEDNSLRYFVDDLDPDFYLTSSEISLSVNLLDHKTLPIKSIKNQPSLSNILVDEVYKALKHKFSCTTRQELIDFLNYKNIKKNIARAHKVMLNGEVL